MITLPQILLVALFFRAIIYNRIFTCASRVGEPIVIGLTLVTLESCHAWTTLALTRDLVTDIAQ